MNSISVRDYKIHNLQKEYGRFSSYLFNYQTHIERCFAENIISINDRNNYLKIINDLLRLINTTYNNNMISIYESNTKEKDFDDYSSHNISAKYDNINELINLYKVLRVDNVDQSNMLYNLIKEPFDDIKKSILAKLGSKIGFYNICDGLSLLIGEQFDKMYDKSTNEYLYLYNKIYIPLRFSIITINNPEPINIKKRKTNKNKKMEMVNIMNDDCINNTDEILDLIKYTNDPAQIFLRKGKNDKDSLVDNCIEIVLKKINDATDTFIIFEGYFGHDPLNIVIRTSQICNNFIYQKKKAIETYITKSGINDKFAKYYLRNTCITDILIMTDEEFCKKLEEEYIKYNKLIKLSFMNLMKEFVKEDKNEKLSIQHMFSIIRLLLLGSDENINVAGLLYGISKEKKPGNDSTALISDIIFRNLSYLSQIKLRKSAVNIKSELDKIKAITLEDVDLKKQIVVCKNMPDSVKKAALDKIKEMKTSNNEYFKQLLYVKTILNYPWPSSDDDSFFADIKKNNTRSKEFLDSVVDKLNSKVYGHTECKDSLKELIGKWISNPTSSGSAIGLVGPPGVGKTLIAKAVGDALNMPLVQITLGGQNDGELLHGHGYTYSGAQPGMIVKKMVEAGSARCVMYFDELDKTCRKHENDEIQNILIHLIDPNTNTEFQDRFFQEFSFPLNKVLFIFSYNDSSQINSVLMDRIKEIRVNPFQLEDKKTITNKFIIKEMSELIGLENGSVIISNEDIDFIIDKHTFEPGVRDLKRKIEKIFLKLNIDKIYKKGLFQDIDTISSAKPITLTHEIIEEYLGKNNIHVQFVHPDDMVGVINGLYATDAGKGGVLPIQVFNNYDGSDGKFILKFTGRQKKVMKESIISAFTTAMHIVNANIRDDFLNKNPHGFHIHTPSCAVPKDGPSAGCAFATAFVSRILNKKIKHNVAMTGEIELTGKVTKIGGLEYKLSGAKRAGVNLVLVSSENAEDIEKIKKDYKDLFDDTFEVKLVNHLKEVLEYALVDFDSQALI